jgi:hypothetical protein
MSRHLAQRQRPDPGADPRVGNDAALRLPSKLLLLLLLLPCLNDLDQCRSAYLRIV